MAALRTKLSKKLFMTLKPGQYIMENTLPLNYDLITENLDKQWEYWKVVNGYTVTIYDSKEDCLRDWWKLRSGLKTQKKTKFVYEGKLNKKLFMDSSNGYYILFVQEPFDYIELSKDRKKQWLENKNNNGLSIRIFKNHIDCAMYRNDILSKYS